MHLGQPRTTHFPKGSQEPRRNRRARTVDARQSLRHEWHAPPVLSRFLFLRELRLWLPIEPTVRCSCTTRSSQALRPPSPRRKRNLGFAVPRVGVTALPCQPLRAGGSTPGAWQDNRTRLGLPLRR